MPRLVLINGAPGSGKSTIAAMLAQDRPMALALDIDVIKHALGDWEVDSVSSGLQARRLSIALAREHLRSGHDVIIGQYLARTAFIEELEHLARECGATFFEFILELDAATLAARLTARRPAPDRTEHAVNNLLVGPEDAPALVDSLTDVRRIRTNAVPIDASGSARDTAALIRTAMANG